MKVLIVDDSPAVRRIVRVLFEDDTTFEVCGEAENGREGLEKAEELRPPGNDDALLRWNACARIIMGNGLAPRSEERIALQSE